MPTRTKLTAALSDLDISLEKSMAAAYLTAQTDTTTTIADTYYPITGPFTNTVLDNFEVGADSLVYKGTETRMFKGLLSVSVQSDTSTTTATITITKNGSVIGGYEVDRLLKLTSDIGSWIVPVDFELATDDEVSLKVKSDKTGAVLTFHSAIANIFPTTHIKE